MAVRESIIRRCPEWVGDERCGKPSALDADECPEHLAIWERDERAEGRTPCACAEGHYGCAHWERGACHGYQPDPDSTLCPDGRSDCTY